MSGHQKRMRGRKEVRTLHHTPDMIIICCRLLLLTELALIELLYKSIATLGGVSCDCLQHMY